MPSTFEAARAEALFVSTLQGSERPEVEQVHEAVATTLRRLGIRGCAACVAAEFGDHPETAVARMKWALDVVRAAYPTRAAAAPRQHTVRRSLALTA